MKHFIRAWIPEDGERHHRYSFAVKEKEGKNNAILDKYCECFSEGQNRVSSAEIINDIHPMSGCMSGGENNCTLTSTLYPIASRIWNETLTPSPL